MLPACTSTAAAVANKLVPSKATAGCPLSAAAAHTGCRLAEMVCTTWLPLPERSVHALTLFAPSLVTPRPAWYHARSPLATVAVGHGLKLCW